MIADDRRAGARAVRMADIFVSFTSSDRMWAFWIGQELERLGHVPRIHEWEIQAGGDIPKWMEESLETADHCLLVVNSADGQSEGCPRLRCPRGHGAKSAP